MSKKDFTRTPDGSLTIVDMNLKAGRSLALPKGSGFLLGDLDNSNTYIYVKVDQATNKVTLQLYVGGTIIEFVPKSALANVALTGEYDDLLHKPDLSKFLTAVTWDDVTGKPVFKTVATTGKYTDLEGLPDLSHFLNAVTWDDVTGKPVFKTVATTGKYTDLEGLPDLSHFLTAVSWDDVTGKPVFKTVATTGKYSDLIDIPQSLSSTDKPTFAGATLKGLVQLGAFNLGGFDFTPYYGSAALGYTLVGQNLSFGGGESDFIHARNAVGSPAALVGGFRFYDLGNDGVLKLLLDMHGATGAITIPGPLVYGTLTPAESPGGLLWHNPITNQNETVTWEQAAAAIGTGGGTGGPVAGVTSVDSVNTDISVSNKTSTPALTLNSGVGANQIAKRNASGNITTGTPSTGTEAINKDYFDNNMVHASPTITPNFYFNYGSGYNFTLPDLNGAYVFDLGYNITCEVPAATDNTTANIIRVKNVGNRGYNATVTLHSGVGFTMASTLDAQPTTIVLAVGDYVEILIASNRKYVLYRYSS